ncbi:MAG: hypothetical protein Q9199_001501 [Rusavskia elegans]
MPRRQHRAHRTPANDPFLIAASTPGHPLHEICQDQRIRPEDAGEFLQMEKDRCNAGRVPYEYDDIVDQVIDEIEAEETPEAPSWVNKLPHRKFKVSFTMTVNDKLHYMDFKRGMPQLINLIISRSTFDPSDKHYVYLDKLIQEAVDGFVVLPAGSPYPPPQMGKYFVDNVHMPDVMESITSAYERLATLGVDVKEIKAMIAKLVDAVQNVPDAGLCLMLWEFKF